MTTPSLLSWSHVYCLGLMSRADIHVFYKVCCLILISRYSTKSALHLSCLGLMSIVLVPCLGLMSMYSTKCVVLFWCLGILQSQHCISFVLVSCLLSSHLSCLGLNSLVLVSCLSSSQLYSLGPMSRADVYVFYKVYCLGLMSRALSSASHTPLKHSEKSVCHLICCIQPLWADFWEYSLVFKGWRPGRRC